MSNSLLPPSSGVWMRHTETVTARLSAITVALRTLWTPTVCPVDLLPYLAWALSVDRWDKSWTAARKIEAIQRSYWLHRRKGTRAAVRRVIEDMGFSASFKEWFETGGERGTFKLEIDVNDIGITHKTLDELNRLISDAKPVSRHISQMNLVASSKGFIYSGTAGYEGDVTTTFPDGYRFNREIRHDETIHYDGLNNHSGFHYD